MALSRMLKRKRLCKICKIKLPTTRWSFCSTKCFREFYNMGTGTKRKGFVKKAKYVRGISRLDQLLNKLTAFENDPDNVRMFKKG